MEQLWQDFPGTIAAVFEGMLDAIKSENIYREFVKRGWKLNTFCELMHTAPQGVRGCLVSDAKGGSIARENQGPYYYECQFGLTDIAFPIFIGDRFITNVYFRSCLTAPPSQESFARVKEKVKGMKIDLKKLEDAYFDVSVVPEIRLKEYLKLGHMFFSYLGKAEEILKLGAARAAKSPHVEKVERFIQENYFDDISLDETAKTVNLSIYHFSRTFKKETGFTFIEYLTRTRMDKAKELLSTTDSKITDIGTSVGYDNITHFNRMFKDLEKMSPREYRSLLKSIVSSP